MKPTTSKQFLQAAFIGALAGMRTTAAPVIATHILSMAPSGKLNTSRLKFMQSPTLAAIFKIVSVSELVVDKLPSTPNRIETGGVAGRALSGALAGAAICKASGINAWKGVAIGGLTAVAATYASYFLRREIVKRAGVADPFIGGIEDIAVIGAGVALCSNT